MKHLLSINELFEIDNISTNNTNIIFSKRNLGSSYNGAEIDIMIKGIPYKFLTCLKELDGKNYIYLSYHIIDHKDYIDTSSKNNNDKYSFIINKDMIISVLNALPIFLEEYKKLLLSDNINPIVNGFYYDADEKRRENIYEYFFKKRLGDRLLDIRKNSFFFVELKTPLYLKDFFL